MSNAAAASGKKLDAGDYAPDFQLDTDSGNYVTLSALKGKNVVVYFYPKDDTPGCTIEAQDFTKLASQFDYNNTVVIGISKDTVESHCSFRDKYALKVILAADVHGTVCEAYDCWIEKNNYGKKYMGIDRATFLIDSKGVVKNAWRKVNAKGHAEEVLEAAKRL